MNRFMVDAAACRRCGLCEKDCVAGIIAREGGTPPAIKPGQEEDCLECQHCLAVCPAGAISVLGKAPAASRPVDRAGLPGLDGMEQLVRSRRSVRNYRREGVDKALIARLLTAAAHAPTGVNNRKLSFTVADDPAATDRLRGQVYAGLREAEAAGRIPEPFAFIKGAAGDWFASGNDLVLRGAPHVLLVSAEPGALCGHEDVIIALAQFELLARSAGLGTCWCGLVVISLELLPDIKALLGIPAGAACYGMLFGHPAYAHARTVQRDKDAAIRTIAL